MVVDGVMCSSGSVGRGGGIFSSEVPPLHQCLTLEHISFGPPKYTRSGELRRALGISLGSTTEDLPFRASNFRPCLLVATEELKQIRDSVLHSSIKARKMILQFPRYSLLGLENSLNVCSFSCGNLSSSYQNNSFAASMTRMGSSCLPSPKFLHSFVPQSRFRRRRHGSSRNAKAANSDHEDGLMDEEERREWRKKIWEVMDKYPDVQEELDPEEKKRKMQQLVAEYPLVVDEDDPDWPEDADGRGFGLDQFFNKISIKNVKKDVDDENYDSDKDIVWQDDDYIRPIKDINSSEWEEIVFKDISPLVILVHNRYRRPKENEQCRDELEKAVNIIWNCNLPSPRCVAIDAVVDCELVSALKVSNFPELIFAKSGMIIYREKVVRPADELSKIMAFFYYGAAKPPFFDFIKSINEVIPSAPISAGS